MGLGLELASCRVNPTPKPYPLPDQVKARMDEYTAINNGDAANHLHGASAAVKRSLHPKT